jgi:Ni,Fe-hydrogenase III small subunit/formate hydrogenlyase subunit 6/NADH:ubiquinone oxidoreductase subunit I
MLQWIARGLGKGRVTTHYPQRAESAPPGFRGRIDVLESEQAPVELTTLCPTRAIAVDARRRLSVDRGGCILCGACVEAAPDRFAFVAQYETAARTRSALVVPEDPGAPLEALRETLADQARALRRSIHVRHIDCGSDGSEEWELQALWNPYYDIQRLGFFLTNAPRHADILVVTGPVTSAMREPLERTWDVMPEPKALVAIGSDACSGGLNAADELTAGGVDAVLPVDVYVPGSPPSPVAIMQGLLLATGLLPAVAA